MTTQAKGTLLQRIRRLLGCGYTLFTTQEIKLAQALQRKFSFGYLLVRLLGFFTKVFLAIALAFILSWIIFIALAVFAFFTMNLKEIEERQEKEKEEREESYGTIEHMTKYPDMYDNY